MNTSMTQDTIITRPLLAATAESPVDLMKLTYPMLASVKIDGIRCLLHPTLGAVSRSFKPIPNEHVRKTLEGLSWLDGELVVVDDFGTVQDFSTTVSGVMTEAGTPKFAMIVFDTFLGPNRHFSDRTCDALQMAEHCNAEVLKAPILWYHPHHLVKNADEAHEFFLGAIAAGHEGMMLRDPKGVYKSGRSTLKQQILVKYKGLIDSEAEGTIIGFEELHTNTNEQKPDAFGLAKRSSHKDGKIPASTLGALVLDTKWGELRVGTGFDQTLRKKIWESQDEYLGKMVTFTYQSMGMKDLPRFPSFKRFRDPRDM